MPSIFVIGLALALIVTTFLLLIFMPTPNCFFSMDKISYQFSYLTRKEQFEKIKNTLDITKYDIDNRQMLYENGMPTEIAENYVEVYDMLRTLPNVERAFFQSVDKKTTDLEKRKGSAHYANNTIRCVLPIILPALRKTSIWVDGESKFFNEGEWLFYDDSRDSVVCNKHKRNNLHLLVVDIIRPNDIPQGIATKIHTTLF